MKKKFYFFLLMLLFQGVLFSQEKYKWEWVAVDRCLGETYGFDLVTDSEGNLYATGLFKGQKYFGDSLLTAKADWDIFVVKMDSMANVLWVRQFGDVSGNYGNCVVLDDSLNIYFNGSMVNTEGKQKSILMKLNPEGDSVWTKYYDKGYSPMYGKGKTLTRWKNRLYVAGYDSLICYGTNGQRQAAVRMKVESVTHDDHGNVIVSSGTQIQFLDSALNVFRSVTVSPGIKMIRDLCVMDSMVYMTGNSQWSLEIGDSVFPGFGYDDIFLAKMDWEGHILWANCAGGETTDMGYSLDILDSTVFVAGTYRNIATFSGITVGKMGSSKEIFVAGYDKKTGALKDLLTAGGSGENDKAYAVVHGPDQRIYVAGIVENWANYAGVNFGDILITTETGKSDMFVAKLTSAEMVARLEGKVTRNGEPTYAMLKVYRLDSGNVASQVYNARISSLDGLFSLKFYNKGKYIIKAQYYSSEHISTYYPRAFRWEDARQIDLDRDTTLTDLNIDLIALPVLEGNSTITGRVMDKDSLPVRFIDMILVNDQDEPVAYTLVDTMGIYRFTKIPNGTYTIVVDTAGIYMENFYTVDLSAKSAFSGYDGYDYMIRDGKVYAINLATSNRSLRDDRNIRIYPVPAGQELYVELPDGWGEKAEIAFYDLSGRKMMQAQLISGGKIDISALPPGTYIARIRSSGRSLFRKIVISR